MKRRAAALFSKAASGARILLILASPFSFPAAPGSSSVAHRSCPHCGSSWVVLAFPTPFLVFPVLAVLAVLAVWAVVLVVFVPVTAVRYSCFPLSLSSPFPSCLVVVPVVAFLILRILLVFVVLVVVFLAVIVPWRSALCCQCFLF